MIVRYSSAVVKKCSPYPTSTQRKAGHAVTGLGLGTDEPDKPVEEPSPPRG
jgi:hypothetical protein